MKTSTLSLRKYALMCCILLLSILSYSQTTIAYHTFGSNLEGWTDGGTQAGRNFNGNSCTDYGAIYTYYDFDLDSSAYLSSPTYDFTPYTDITISFCNINSNRQDTGDGYDLEYFDGSSWTLIEDYRKGTDYFGSGQESFSVSINSGTYTFDANSRIRFVGRCDATNEWAVWDDILITGTGCATPINSFPYTEGFESGLGDWSQDTGDDRDWTRRSGGTPSSDTGPNSANGGSWYMFTEASDPNFNDVFNLVSPCFDLSAASTADFSFYYHMYGSDMGTLDVEVSTDGGASYSTPVWTQSGQVQTSSGQAWILANVDLSSYVGQVIMIRFNGTTGSNYRGDMAIDDISLTTAVVSGPEISVLGNGTTIADGDTTPSAADDTDFGTVSVTLATQVNTFTIQNFGTTTLNLTGPSPYVSISGAHAGDFTVTSTPSNTIGAGGASTTFDITFNPSAVGLRTATVTILNDDSDENPYTFNIQGNGLSPLPEIDVQGNGTLIVDGDTTPSAIDDTYFGVVNPVSGSNTNTFTIRNTGALPLSVGTISITGAHAGDFTVTSAPAGSVGSGGSTTFDITFDASSVGLRTASVSIANNDGDENPYNFDIEGSGISGPPSYTTYFEDFDITNGGWTSITSTNDSWVWTNSFPTNELGEGSFWRNNNFDNYNNNTDIVIQSPVIDLSGLYNLQLSLDVKCKTEDSDDGMIIQYSISGGTWTTLGASGDGTNWYEGSTSVFGSDAWNGDTHTASPTFNPHNQFNNTRIDLDESTFSNQSNVRFRIQFRSDGSNVDDGVAFDNFRIEADPITSLSNASVAPANLTNNLRLWLKMNEGISASDGDPLTSWEDQAYATALDKEDASAASSIAPTYRDNATRNINFNPVADFDHNNVEYMNGKGGFFSQDYYVVFHSDDEVDTNTGAFSPGRQFAIGGRFSAISFHEDPTGLGLGSVSARYTNEILSHTVDSYPLSGPPDADSYGRAFTTTTDSYQNHPTIVNVRTNGAGTASEIYKNGKRVDNTTGVSGDGGTLNFTEFNNLSFLIGTGRSGIAGRTSSQMNGMIAEVISYVSPNSALNQQKIQSYLALKYGVTLQSSSSAYAHSNHRQNDVDYIDSQGTVIWDTSANSAYNYDIAGIGRDNASILNQKQSKSQNVESDGTGFTSGFLTMGLTDIYDTNKLNQSGNATNFNDREFLVWGNNGADINLASSTITVNMSAGISPALTTDVSFTAMQRVWKVVETGGDIPSVKVRLPQNAIRNISPPGNYYMFISSTGVFDPTADYRVMTADGNGNLETNYDFDGTKYITFGYAPQVIVERSVYFDGAVDYIDVEDALDLNPTGFTISAWIKRDAADSGTKSILSKRDATFTQGYDLRILNNDRIQLWWKNGTNQILNAPTRIPDGEWHHIAAIYDGTRASIYIDGVLSISDNRTPPVDTNESFYIAAAGKNSPVQHFRGNIDEVRIWDTDLTIDQVRFIMNQEILENTAFVAGDVLPTTITKNDVGTIPWTELAGYYPMSTYTYTNTEDASGNGNQGALRNLDTVDRQTAPLPYESQANGDWTTEATWLNNAVQTLPNALSIVDNVTPVDWNIVRISHDVTIDTEVVLGRDRQVLGLMLDAGELTVDGNNADAAAGNGLTVSHYLKLDGKIDLEGQSQLVQTIGSDLDPTSSGSLEKDQQGTADVYTYNYWSSPVGETNATTNNNSYSVTDVMYDGVNPINFITSGYDGADGATISIADYWIWKFANQLDDDYSAWQHVRRNGTLLTGEGFTMKGPGSGTIVDQQNYVFLGKPNNGDVNLTLNAGNDYLVGNPYPSAIDANQFITDNGPNITGAGADPLISGTLYFWEHWGGGSHNLAEYQGGYATYNFSGGVGAPSLGTNDPDVATGGTPTKLPARYIPVSQGFFVVGENTGTINFNNGQRVYRKEAPGTSIFVRNDGSSANTAYNNEDLDDRMKFRIGFNSINTIHRQLLLTIDENTTTGFDWAFDAKIYDNQMDDLYWIIDSEKYTIQGSNEAEPESVYPLGIKTSDSGLNTITIDSLENVPDSIEIYIHDIDNDTYHNLREGDFEFFLPAGEYLDRFELTFRDVNADSLSVDDTELRTLDVFYNNDTRSIALLNPNLVDVKSIELLNIIGQNITTIEDISELDYSEYKVKSLSTGTYIIKINTLSGMLSKKVLVK
ncbi:choice-of-anchor D domain-containing protein [Psychroserpens algicola]|uniref:Choice-of-anchor D domain-containing protein n=1 Tax=Psychroserpens algicola TaxID=1719034 RepID=A0ABT0HDA4_9FLAO|nr:choice-of-anchor D domain-containing protein [Psychroserpens algicola]MCK8482019.1 choice-of-anchor D domain-containing protein [Psychroserpens algicola]